VANESPRAKAGGDESS